MWYRYTLTSCRHLDPAEVQGCFIVVEKKNNPHSFFKYQQSQILAGLEVKPSLCPKTSPSPCIGHVPLQGNSPDLTQGEWGPGAPHSLALPA